MRILLINPAYDGSWFQFHPLKRTFSVYASGVSPPLGLLYVATVLENQGYEVSLIDNDALKWSDDELLGYIKETHPDVIGFSILTASCFNAHRLAKEIKDRYPDIKIIYGGPSATIYPERLMNKYGFVDYLIQGDGEYTTLNLLRELENGQNLKNVRGLVYREDKKLVLNEAAPQIRDLDDLPFPNRNLLKTNYDLSLSWGDFKVRFTVGKYTGMLTSRGCPNSCRFCQAGSNHSGWRGRSAKNVVDELELLEGQGYKHVFFVDDNFSADKKRVFEICKLIKERGLKVYWSVEMSVENGSYEMFEAMKDAGCDSILFGFESANQRILDYYCKRITPELSRKTVEAARRAGISCIIGTFLLGAPDETYEEAKRTVDFGFSLDLDALILFSLSVKPDTPIWDELKEKGYLTNDFIEKRWETSGINVYELNSKLSKRELDTLIEDGYTKFLWRPEYLVKHIYRNFRHRFRRMWMAKNLRAIAPFLKASLKTRMMKGKEINTKVNSKV